MNKLFAPILAFSLLGAGSALAQPGYPPVPPPRYERVPPPPGGRMVWEPGHWHWTGARYAWIGGRYVPRRASYGHYVPGRWQFNRHTGQYVWRPAHWG